MCRILMMLFEFVVMSMDLSFRYAYALMKSRGLFVF